MKRTLIGLLTLIAVSAHAQQFTRVYLNDKDDDVEASVSVYRKEGLKNNNFAWVDTVRSYYTKSSHLRSIEVYNAKGMRNGLQRYYFDNGALKKEHVYAEAKIVGVSSGYYENKSRHYRLKFSNAYNLENDEHMVVDYWDSLGNQLVKDGNGKCRCYVTIMSEIYRQEGTLVDTLREGEWLTYKNDSLFFRETYDRGKLTSGTRYYGAETQVTYTENFKMPQPVDGVENLYRWISKEVKYPADARRLGVEGTVYVGFVVATSGVLKDVKTVKGVGYTMDAESERVVSLVPPWTPGLFKGKPMAVRYVLPIKFKLEEVEYEEEKKKGRRGRKKG